MRCPTILTTLPASKTSQTCARTSIGDSTNWSKPHATCRLKCCARFHDWARPVEIKLRGLPAIDERLGLLEERISRIERGDKHV